MALVLVADGHAGVRQLVSVVLSANGHEVLQAADATAALQLIQQRHPDVLILSDRLRLRFRTDLVQAARTTGGARGTSVIMLAGDLATAPLESAGADVVLAKPFSVLALADMVEACLGGATQRQTDHPASVRIAS